MNPLFLCDFYKQSHSRMYPDGLEYLYSNTTPRKSRIAGIDHVVVFGIQYFIKEYLIKQWDEHFFSRDIEEVLAEYHSVIDTHLGNTYMEDNIRYLHALEYLPIEIKALPEGTLCPIGVPLMTIKNTDPKCAWLTNFLETITQTIIWKPITSATIAYEYKKLLNKYADETCTRDHVQWQAHDFSMRGMPSFESCQTSGSGHLLSFSGTDSIPSIVFLNKYYNAEGMVGASVPASEHSVQCSHYDNSDETYLDFLLDKFPTGIISIVADGYDYWGFLKLLEKKKDKILARDGKVVVRPDTGAPERIIAGYTVKQVSLNSNDALEKAKHTSGNMALFTDCDCIRTLDGKYLTNTLEEITYEEAVGSIHILYSIFGGSVNSKGYLELDQHIGLIYGDSITPSVAKATLEKLKQDGFASNNVIFGIGSFTYAYNTRDTFGLACKATWCQINGIGKNIFKDPKTGDGMKKSAKGLLRVVNDNGLKLLQEQESDEGGELVTVFRDSQLLVEYNLEEIRSRLHG